MRIIPYLNMAGNAEEAMNYYKSIFGGTASVVRWSEMPPNPKMPVSDEWKEKVMHATLDITDTVTIYLSDSWVDNESPINNNVYLHIEFDSEAELRRVFEALVAEGKVNMPVDTMFWGAVYGDLSDKFGVSWGLHYQLPEVAPEGRPPEFPARQETPRS